MTTMPIISDKDPNTSHLQPTSDSIQTMTDSTTPVVSQPNTLEIGSPLFYGIVGAGAAIVIMTLLCLICICVMLGCRREYRCEYTIHAFKYGVDIMFHFWYQVDLELGLPTEVN